MTTHLESHAHAVVKNNLVFNIFNFDGHDESLLESVRQHFDADKVICCCNYGIAYIDGTWDGTKFWRPQPYPSWIKGTDNWEAPTTYPTTGKTYILDETTVSWVEVTE